MNVELVLLAKRSISEPKCKPLHMPKMDEETKSFFSTAQIVPACWENQRPPYSFAVVKHVLFAPFYAPHSP